MVYLQHRCFSLCYLNVHKQILVNVKIRWHMTVDKIAADDFLVLSSDEECLTVGPTTGSTLPSIRALKL